MLQLVVGGGHDDLEILVVDPEPDWRCDRLAGLAVEREGGRRRRIEERPQLARSDIQLNTGRLLAEPVCRGRKEALLESRGTDPPGRALGA